MNRLSSLSLLALTPLPLLAQGMPDLSALAPGYAQLLSLPTEADISSATYQIADPNTRAAVHVTRLPATFNLAHLTPGLSLEGTLSAGYLKMTGVFDTGFGSVATRWQTFSVTGGLGLRLRLAPRWTSTFNLDAGLARLDNHATYSGPIESIRNQYDGQLFNWHTNAWILTPNLGLRYLASDEDHGVQVRAHVGRSWISSFHTQSPALRFHETAQAFSMEGERSWKTHSQLAGLSLWVVALGGFSGFFGGNRDALGFNSLAEAGLGLEAPLAGKLKRFGRLRLSGTYLVGPQVRGWSFGLSLTE